MFGKHNLNLGGQIVDSQFNYYKNVSSSGPMRVTFNATQTEAFTSGTYNQRSTPALLLPAICLAQHPLRVFRPASRDWDRAGWIPPSGGRMTSR